MGWKEIRLWVKRDFSKIKRKKEKIELVRARSGAYFLFIIIIVFYYI
jgi:hypothetical protein